MFAALLLLGEFVTGYEVSGGEAIMAEAALLMCWGAFGFR
jgi:hypothetical protein